MSVERDLRHVMIEGRVQGVGYRAWLAHRAQEAGLDGWVRNRRDGSVEALLAGPAPAVAALVQACLQGPALARPDRVVDRATETEPAPGFHTRATI